MQFVGASSYWFCFCVMYIKTILNDNLKTFCFSIHRYFKSDGLSCPLTFHHISLAMSTPSLRKKGSVWCTKSLNPLSYLTVASLLPTSLSGSNCLRFLSLHWRPCKVWAKSMVCRDRLPGEEPDISCSHGLGQTSMSFGFFDQKAQMIITYFLG